MRDADKPFVIYRRGPMSFSIVPRSARGWIQFGVWMALLVPIMIGFVLHAQATGGTSRFYVGLALFIATLVGWNVAMIRWMRARAEVVDLQELLKLKREQERKGRR